MSGKVLRILTVLLFLITVISGGMIVTTLVQSNSEKEDFERLRDLTGDSQGVKNVSEDGVPEALETEPETEKESMPGPEVSPEPQPVFKRDLMPLFEANSDCIGWICIPGTAVDYPVMHTPAEPHKYLHLNFDGEYSASGVPFLQESNTTEGDHIVIYGHNMKNGSMFADLKKYRNVDYCKEHSVIEWETAEGCLSYTVFAVVQLKSDDDWYGFHTAINEEEYDTRVAEIKHRSLYDTGIVPEYGRQLITLSTCYGADNNDRIIVIGVESAIRSEKETE